jgi:peptidoglycan-associated lipoprotein
MRAICVTAFAILVGCAHAQPPATASSKQKQAPEAQVPVAASPATPVAPVEAVRSTSRPAAPSSIYFDFDRAQIKPGSRPILQVFYQAVRKRPDVQVRIEGNCDERGSSEYNIALGQRRADAAKRYLERLGLSASRITAVSNGAEKPRAAGHDEDSWRENRRDDLIAGNGAVGSL